VPDSRKLIRSGLHALLAVSLAMFCVAAIDTAITTLDIVSVSTGAFFGFIFTFLVGAPIVVVYGVPAYMLLSRRGSANWLSVLLLGLLPGLAFIPVSPRAGILAAACGSAIALLTHSFVRR